MYYVIAPTDKDLQHKYHKYIERKRGKNGKWQYIYYKAKKNVKNKLGITAKEELKRAGDNYAKSLDRRMDVPISQIPSAERLITIRENELAAANQKYQDSFIGKLANILGVDDSFESDNQWGDVRVNPDKYGVLLNNRDYIFNARLKDVTERTGYVEPDAYLKYKNREEHNTGIFSTRMGWNGKTVKENWENRYGIKKDDEKKKRR